MTTRISHFNEDLAPEYGNAIDVGPSFRVCSGAIRHTGGSFDTVVGMGSSTKHQHTIDGDRGAGIASTYSSTYGSPSVELEPGNPSSRTTVQTAIRMGLLKARHGGGYEDVTGQAEAAQEALAEPQEAAPEVPEGAEFFSPLEDVAYDRLIAPLPQHAYDSAQASMVAAVALGHGTIDGAAQSLAESAGMEPTQALELIEAAHAHYTKTVTRALAPLNLKGERLEQAFAYMQTNAPQKLQDAIQRLTHARDLSGFKELAVAFKVANPGPVQGLKNAGYETYIDRTTGDLMARKGQNGWFNATQALNP